MEVEEISKLEKGGVEVKELQELDFETILYFSILQALKSALEDVYKYYLAVENIESLLADELEYNQEYYKKVEEFEKEIIKRHGISEEKQSIRLLELARFKFRELMKIIKRKIPHNVIGEI